MKAYLIYQIIWFVLIGLLPIQSVGQTTGQSNKFALFEIYGVDEDEMIVPLLENTRPPKEMYGTARLDWQHGTTSTDDIELTLLNLERRFELYKSFTVAYGASLAYANGTRLVADAGTAPELLRTNGAGVGVYVGIRLDSFRVGKARFFAEGAVGSLYVSDSIPPGGDNLVFFHRYALGLSFPIAHKLHFLIGASHIRFSSKSQCCSGSTRLRTNGGFVAISYEY